MTNEINDRIERSSGELVTAEVNGVPVGMPVRVGGGYRGKRDDQDEAVKEFARCLADMFPHDIQIRYNSDRLGGGAWLKDGKRHVQVGLGADLTYTDRWRQRRDTFHEWDAEYDDIDFRDFPSMKDLDPDDLALKYTVKLEPPACDPELCNRREDDPENRYFHRRFDTIGEAWEFFTDHVNVDRVNPPE